jgi:peptide/nickel transport system ATP-binding protein
MSEHSELLLKVRGLHIEGRSEERWQEIVHGIDLDLHKGEVLGLIGESGAGKSTVGLAAMGYTRDGCRISAGTVEFDGMELTKMPVSKRRRLRGSRIAYVAQSAAASFNPAHRLIDQYTEGPVQHGVKDRSTAQSEAIDLYRRLQLPDPDDIGFRYPHQVSGGQLQRAMTAMAMACQPDLIIFDEPTTALDVTTQIEVLAAIRDVVEQFGTAAIYITHDLAVVAQMADRIMVLLKGRLVEQADTRTMLSTPKEDYTKSLWAVREFRATAKAEPGADEIPVVRVNHVTAAYGKVPVLEDVSFDIHKGRTVAVVGESGSGKSTTARCITGLLPPLSGQVLFNGQPLPPATGQRSKDQLRQIQMIYQMADTALNPKQRIRDIIGRPVEFYLGLRGKPKVDRIRDLLREIELEPDAFIDRLPGELSGGQKQLQDRTAGRGWSRRNDRGGRCEPCGSIVPRARRCAGARSGRHRTHLPSVRRDLPPRRRAPTRDRARRRARGRPRSGGHRLASGRSLHSAPTARAASRRCAALPPRHRGMERRAPRRGGAAPAPPHGRVRR